MRRVSLVLPAPVSGRLTDDQAWGQMSRASRAIVAQCKFVRCAVAPNAWHAAAGPCKCRVLL